MNRFSKEKELEICNLYLDGKDTVIIGKLFNTYNTSIRRVLLRYNIKLRTTSEVTTNVKTNPFLNLENDEVQYWLGILMTDGNLSKERYRIALSLKDIEHLEKYVKFLKSDFVKVKNYNNNRYKIKEYYVNFQSKEIHNYLNNIIGITPKKSFTLDPNINITWSMLRGIIDGDGYYRVKDDKLLGIEIFSASNLFINKISKFLDTKNIRHSVKMSKPNLYRIGIYYNEGKLECIYNMYNTSQVHLDRKFEKIGPSLEKSKDLRNPNSGKEMVI